MKNLTNEEKQAILDNAPGDAQYYSIIDGKPMFYKLTLGGWSAFKLKNVCDKEKQWLRHSSYSITGVNRIDLLKAETKEWKERQQKIANVINLSACNVPLLVALGWDKDEITRNVTEMSHTAGSLEYARYVRAEKEALEPEKLLLRYEWVESNAKELIEWQNGDECIIVNSEGYVLRNDSEVFIGKTCEFLESFELPDGVVCAAVYLEDHGADCFRLDMLSKPESPEQKAKAEREEKAIKLHEIHQECYKQYDDNHPYAQVWGELSEGGKGIYLAMIDAGIKLPE